MNEWFIFPLKYSYFYNEKTTCQHIQRSVNWIIVIISQEWLVIVQVSDIKYPVSSASNDKRHMSITLRTQ